MKQTRGYLLLICIVSAMGGLLFGYDWVVIGGAKIFYFYKALKNYDAESSVGTSWANQATVGSSTTATRSFGVSLRASF